MQNKTDGYVIFKNGQRGIISYGGTIVRDSLLSKNKEVVAVSLPNSVECIDDGAFEGCTELKEIKIPNSVKTIGWLAFGSCSIEELHIPESVTSIGLDICEPYKLNYIFVDVNNPVYCSKGNCLIDIEEKTLVLGCNRSFIPDDGSVTKIGCSAFLGCDFPELVVPESIEEIEDGAFGCGFIDKLYIHKTIKNIENGAFDTSSSSSLVIHYSGTQEQWNKVYHGNDVKVVFNVKIPKNKQGTVQYKNGKTNIIPFEVESFNLKLFAQDAEDEIVKVVLSENTKKIVAGAFSNFKSLKEVYIPESVKTIVESAFDNCPLLTVHYDGSPRGWKKIYPKNDVKVVCKRKFF